MDVGHAIALLIGEADARRKGEIGAEAVGRRQAGPLADQHHHHPRAEHSADLVAQRHPRARCDHDMAEPDPRLRQARGKMANQFDGVDIDGRRRQPVADHDHNLACAAALFFQRAP